MLNLRAVASHRAKLAQPLVGILREAGQVVPRELEEMITFNRGRGGGRGRYGRGRGRGGAGQNGGRGGGYSSGRGGFSSASGGYHRY